jgi:hypothetical protein
MWVKPAAGLKVPYPNSTARLPPEGAEVKDGDLYWLRRVRDGDVTVEGQASHRRHTAQQDPRREA